MKPEDVISSLRLNQKVGLPVVDKDNRGPGKNELEGVDEIIGPYVFDDHD